MLKVSSDDHLGWEDVLYDGVFAALLTLSVTGTLLHQPATHIYLSTFIYLSAKHTWKS